MISIKSIPLLFLGILMLMHPFYAQETFGNLEEIGGDSALFIGGSSVMLLQKGKVEINTSSTLNSYILGVQESRESSPIIDRFRTTSFISRADVYLGVSEKGSWDLGIRAEYRRQRFDNGARSSPLSVFDAHEDDVNNTEAENNIDNSFGGLTHVGIRFRVKPFPQNNKFTVLGGYSVGAIKSERFQRNLTATSDQVDLSLTYFKPLNPRSFYYVALSGFYDPQNKVDLTSNYSLAGTLAFINMSLNNRFGFYPGLSYIMSAEPALASSGQKGLVWTNRRLNGFLGTQLQFNRKLLVNATFNLNIISELSNPWFEIIPQSESTFNLFFRILL